MIEITLAVILQLKFTNVSVIDAFAWDFVKANLNNKICYINNMKKKKNKKKRMSRDI